MVEVMTLGVHQGLKNAYVEVWWGCLVGEQHSMTEVFVIVQGDSTVNNFRNLNLNINYLRSWCENGSKLHKSSIKKSFSFYGNQTQLEIFVKFVESAPISGKKTNCPHLGNLPNILGEPFLLFKISSCNPGNQNEKQKWSWTSNQSFFH